MIYSDEYLEKVLKRGDSVEYKLNEVTFPLEGCGPLSVFTNLKAVKIFTENDDDERYFIYRCEYEPADTRLIWCLETRFKSSIEFHMPGTDGISNIDYTTAKWVKLLELIE